ncbi:MAG: ATP-binding cassette domain-containing protein [Bacteroides sp.]|nr:ATP-binding cassette domain-containing protein [Bacteroides sp.]MCM1095330.1 ATP-binding cassette domain-containing protein [Terasakiella sp.]
MSLPAPDGPVIELRGVEMRRDDRIVLDGIDLQVAPGDFVAVTGPNGGGKTTLLRIILGLLRPTRGTVSVRVPRSAIGYLPQKNTIDAHFPVSVRDVVASGLLGIPGLDPDDRRTRIDRAIGRIDLADCADRPIGRLSGGQVQRALLGRAIVADPALLVLDEPLSYVDKHFEHRIYHLLAEMAPACTIVLVSHEMSTIDAMANRHFIIDRTATECTAARHGIHTDCDCE